MLASDELEYIEYGEEKYPIAFNLNVNAKLQKEFGSIKKWSEKVFPKDEEDETETDMSVLIRTCAIMINEGIDIEGKREPITDTMAGRILTSIGTLGLIEKINSTNGISDVDEDTNEIEEDDTPR